MKDSVENATERTKEILEKDNNSKLIDESQLINLGYSDLAKWIKDIAKYGNIKRTMLIFKRNNCDNIRIKFFM